MSGCKLSPLLRKYIFYFTREHVTSAQASDIIVGGLGLANGRTHAQAADVVIIVGGIVSFALLPPITATAVVGGLVIGKYANPDRRDLENKRLYADSLIHKELGCLIGSLWQLFWWPLAKCIGHRGWASHLAGPATIIAWIYMFLPWLTLLAIVVPNYLVLALIVMVWTLPGWFAQDVVHLALDGWRVKW